MLQMRSAEAFATIKSSTGISDIEEIVKIFIGLEQRNFSLLTRPPPPPTPLKSPNPPFLNPQRPTRPQEGPQGVPRDHTDPYGSIRIHKNPYGPLPHQFQKNIWAFFDKFWKSLSTKWSRANLAI